MVFRVPNACRTRKSTQAMVEYEGLLKAPTHSRRNEQLPNQRMKGHLQLVPMQALPCSKGEGSQFDAASILIRQCRPSSGGLRLHLPTRLHVLVLRFMSHSGRHPKSQVANGRRCLEMTLWRSRKHHNTVHHDCGNGGAIEAEGCSHAPSERCRPDSALTGLASRDSSEESEPYSACQPSGYHPALGLGRDLGACQHSPDTILPT